MGDVIETFRGAVQPWECDVVEHFTVAFYFDKLDLVSPRLVDLVELGPAGVTPRSAPPITDCYVRYQKELRAGDVFTIESGIIGRQGSSTVLGHRFINTESGEVCTTVEMTVETTARADVAAMSWDGPAREERAEISAARSWQPCSRDVVQPFEVDW